MTYQNFKNLFIFLTLISMSNIYPMMRALNTAATGMKAQEEHVNTISNNIANSNTTGYKASRTEFEDLMYETIKEPGSRSSADTTYNVGIQLGSGAKLSGTNKIHSQGGIQITNSPYDLMVSGDGFFGVIVGNQILYTRDGSFNVNSQGILQTRKGYPVYPTITLPPNTKSLNISDAGVVQAYLSNQLEPIGLGTIPIFTFVNPKGLKDMGGNLAKQTVASGQPIENIAGDDNAGAIAQGSLETSNVNVMTEMTNLIKAQRSYEMNSKVM
ncbi:flagellar basal-body rod protein FlgG, partial [Bacteriovoracaceae bacterium]|nr:flagellar basal-body rod protein FlgG [Bacteriovoracaceae bacterium]